MALTDREIEKIHDVYTMVSQFRKDLVSCVDKSGLWGCEPVTRLYDEVNKSCNQLWNTFTKPDKNDTIANSRES